ncbi:MAG: Arginine-tRNA ligase [Candidatus Nomurabacteria bacterium GW2011_GWB1_47_6]|uniref:Arginine--tRNA ligase n=2 Tax=Parcubacteria group TaxID=1794811 RepID=A0A0G1W0T1_9BACT|nr:MAG: Arginine-tRNA ligase [Candidatus Nomurabacteria bacterium GW2011_GWB1_47_6]
MQEKIQRIIKDALTSLGIAECDFKVEHPDDLKNGDYFTNVALVCAKVAGDAPPAGGPNEIAKKIIAELEKNLPQKIERMRVAGPGFINFYLSPEFFRNEVEDILNKGDDVGKNAMLSGNKIMVEYTDPNPFKPFHIGHLMTNAIGESVARILEHSGAKVSRANYQGDVGLHVAKAIYGLLKNLDWRERKPTHSEEAENIGKAYMFGSKAYEKDPGAKREIDEINKKIYEKSDEEVNGIYDWGFKATMEAFEDLYKILGTKFDYYFLESVVADIGNRIVRNNIPTVFEESEDAVVFKAEKYDPKLHTRVFITSKGLPTYETKELGLAEEKFKTNPGMHLSITVTANEQADYMRVVYKALSLIHPEYENKMTHITHGMMRFASGKMGSRKGNAITGESLLNDVRLMVAEKMQDREFGEEEREKIAADVAVSALKYSILKQSIGGDIIYDFDKSISFDGDSGPYLCYSYARASSVLEKAKKENILPDPHAAPEEVWEVEKLIYHFSEIVERAAREYEPHYITHYLIELARAYNSFYGNNIIVNKEDKTSPYKIALTFSFTFVMKTGLHLLGIKAPAKM